MTLPPSASTATKSFRPEHAADRATSAAVSRASWSASTMLRASSTMPPTRTSQSSRSRSSLSATSVPRNPTSRSEPSSGSRAARRAGSGSIAVRQLAARRTATRLAATSRGNQLLHPRAIDGLPHITFALDRRADDEPVGDRQELRRGLGGGPPAREGRHLRGGAPPPPSLRERRRLAGGRGPGD